MKRAKGKRKTPLRKLAEQIARRLFTDGQERRAARLVMDYEGTTDMCGWAESCAADYVEEILEAARSKRK